MIQLNLIIIREKVGGKKNYLTIYEEDLVPRQQVKKLITSREQHLGQEQRVRNRVEKRRGQMGFLERLTD